MGISGCGKSTIGKQLAACLDMPFLDADDYHPAANITKMRNGLALTDADREPWLERLAHVIAEESRQSAIVLACSALKKKYRLSLAKYGGNLKFIYLRINNDTAAQRLSARKQHFMPASLIQSQTGTLEEPEDALVVDGTLPVSTIVGMVKEYIETHQA